MAKLLAGPCVEQLLLAAGFMLQQDGMLVFPKNSSLGDLRVALRILSRPDEDMLTPQTGGSVAAAAVSTPVAPNHATKEMRLRALLSESKKLSGAALEQVAPKPLPAHSQRQVVPADSAALASARLGPGITSQPRPTAEHRFSSETAQTRPDTVSTDSPIQGPGTAEGVAGKQRDEPPLLSTLETKQPSHWLHVALFLLGGVTDVCQRQEKTHARRRLLELRLQHIESCHAGLGPRLRAAQQAGAASVLPMVDNVPGASGAHAFVGVAIILAAVVIGYG